MSCYVGLDVSMRETAICVVEEAGDQLDDKKVRRLMREHGLQPRRRRCYVITSDSDHELSIFPNLAKDIAGWLNRV